MNQLNNAKGGNMKPTNIKDGKRVPITHGELFFQPIDKMPKGTTTSHKLFVVGHSETGHHHVLESKQEFELLGGVDRAILLNDVGKLFHQKDYDVHETQILAPGAYQVYYKKEYSPFTKVMERVFD